MKNYYIKFTQGSQKFTSEESQLLLRAFSSEREARDYAEKLKKEGKITGYSISDEEVR